MAGTFFRLCTQYKHTGVILSDVRAKLQNHLRLIKKIQQLICLEPTSFYLIIKLRCLVRDSLVNMKKKKKRFQQQQEQKKMPETKAVLELKKKYKIKELYYYK